MDQQQQPKPEISRQATIGEAKTYLGDQLFWAKRGLTGDKVMEKGMPPIPEQVKKRQDELEKALGSLESRDIEPAAQILLWDALHSLAIAHRLQDGLDKKPKDPNLPKEIIEIEERASRNTIEGLQEEGSKLINLIERLTPKSEPSPVVNE